MSSRKIKWLIAGMIALLAIATGGYMVVDHSMKQKEAAELEETQSLSLFQFNADSIRAATLDTSDGHFQFEIVDGIWAMTDTDYAYAFDINTYYLTTICSYLSNLTAEKKFEIPDADLQNYGLDDPVVLDCTDGVNHYALYVGNPSATKEYYYVKLPDDDTVYGISYDYGMLFHGDLSYLKSSYLVNCYDVEINALQLIHEEETVFTLQISDEQWEMTEPLPDANLNSAQVKSLLSTLVRLELDSYVELADADTDLTTYGLDKPDYRLTVGKTDGESFTIDFAENGDNFYVLYENTGEIAEVAKNTVSFLETDISEFLVSTVYSLNMDTVSALDVKVKDVAFRMEMDTANGQYRYNDVDIDEMGTDAVSLFTSLYHTVSNLSYETLDLDTAPDVNADAAATFHYTLTDGSETELRLIEKEENLYYAVIDGKYTGLLVRHRSLNGNTGVLTFHERMTDYLAEHET